VSGKALDVMALAIRTFDLDPAELVAGTSLRPHEIASPPSRLDWHAFATLHNRAAEQIGLDALYRLGRQQTELPNMSRVVGLASLVASPARLYAMAPTLGLSMMFPMVEGTHERISDTRCRIRASLPPGYTPSPAFFHVTRGNFETIPHLLGESTATVSLTTDGHSATFEIHHPPSRTVWARIRNLWNAMFRADQVLEQLTEQNEELARQLAATSAAQERAERAMATQDTLLTAVSHELRTPLGQVLGLLELVHRDPSVSDLSRSHVAQAHRSARRLVRTVDELVQVAALGDAAAEPEAEVLDVSALTASVLRTYQSHPSVALTCEVPVEGSWYVATPRGWLRTILSELVSNAFKYTTRGTVTVRVAARASSMPGRVDLHIQVIDTGMGIEVVDQARVFEPFAQVDAGRTRRAEGVGLGLTLVRSLSERLGGRVDLQSEPGFGTVVDVHLNLIEAEPGSEADSFPPEEVSLLAAPVPELEPSQPSESDVEHQLLVVDDHPLNRMLLSKLGERLGYEVHAVEGGEEALAELARRPYGLVFMDVQMPGMDGLEATRRIRSTPGLSSLPVVAITAQVAPGDRERCLDAGMDTYVPKPVDVVALQAAMDAAVEAARARREGEGKGERNGDRQAR